MSILTDPTTPPVRQTSGSLQIKRTGARRPGLVPNEIVVFLEGGCGDTVNLMEQMAINLDVLLSNRVPELGPTQVHHLPLKTRLFKAASMLLARIAPHDVFARVSAESDTVRAVGAIAVGVCADLPSSARLQLLGPFADDEHFGVREWAWIGLREREGEALFELVDGLRTWASSGSPNLRRFAIEVSRPRGVWCRHLEGIKEDPEPARRLLDQLMTDSSPYVQKSVGNWLNDARWTRPDWVEDFCDNWLFRSDISETRAICRRALRRDQRSPS